MKNSSRTNASFRLAATPPLAPLKSERLLDFLTNRFRVIGDYQLSHVSRHKARALLRRLQHRELVDVRMVIVPPELTLKTPVFSWQPHDPPPNYSRLAWKLASRWQGPHRSVLIAVATEKARRETGGRLKTRPLRRTEVSHDLHVTAIYLKLCRERPDQAALWVHEDDTSHRTNIEGLVPDAMLGATAIEFGGRYRAAKLRAIHRGHATQDQPYEIW